MYAINPLSVARYREQHSVARTKSDRVDAQLLANILRTDRAAHRPLPVNSELAQSIAVGEHVLEVGCGTGVVTREVGRRVGPSGRVVGLDPSPLMLSVAREIADQTCACAGLRMGRAPLREKPTSWRQVI